MSTKGMPAINTIEPNIEALQDLLRLLRRIEEQPMVLDDGQRVRFEMSSLVYEDDCGTAACALGHFILDPTLSAKYDAKRGSPFNALVRHGGRTLAWDRAAMSIFGVTMEVADEMFAANGDRSDTLPEVIKRVERVLKRKGRPA